MNKFAFEPNYELLTKLKELYGISHADIARECGVSEGYISKMFKEKSFSMWHIDRIAHLAMLAIGAFQLISGEEPDTIIQVEERQQAVYMLFVLVEEAVNERGSLVIVSSDTRLPVRLLKKMRKRATDAEHGRVTPEDVLKAVKFTDYLTLVNSLQNPDQTRYIDDPNGLFPMPKERKNKVVPAESYFKYKQSHDKELEESKQVAEDLQIKFDVECQYNEDLKSEIEALLAKNAESVNKNTNEKNEIKRLSDLVSSRNSDMSSLKQRVLKIFGDIEQELNDMTTNPYDTNVYDKLIRLLNLVEKCKKEVRKYS